MRNSDYRKFAFFMLLTLALVFIGFVLIIVPFPFVINNELGDIYWAVLLPIFAFLIMAVFLTSFATYMAGWIYFVKTKGLSRWFGLLGIIPVIGPIFLIIKKSKLPQEGEGPYVTTIATIGMLMPLVAIFSFFIFFSSIKKDIQNVIKDQYTSKSKIDAIVKGAHHEK